MSRLELVRRVALALGWNLDYEDITAAALRAQWDRMSPGVQSVYRDCAETHLKALRHAGLTVSLTPRKKASK